MIAAWVCLLVAAAAVTTYAARVARAVGPVTWPDETPVHVHENRAHDQVLPHLARLVAAEDPAPVHRLVRAAVEQLLASPTVERDPDPRVAAFLADPPLAAPDNYRADLATVLDRLERR